MIALEETYFTMASKSDQVPKYIIIFSLKLKLASFVIAKILFRVLLSRVS